MVNDNQPVEGEIVPSKEDVRRAVDIIRQARKVPPRGDSFDDEEDQSDREVDRSTGQPGTALDRLVQNPRQTLGVDQLNEKQTLNAETAVSTIAYGLGYRFLAPLIGGRLAGVLAGLGGAVGAEFLFKKRRRK